MKNQTLLTITIGIPAYNEERNIPYLVTALMGQDLQHATLSQIIIISDGSTDNTVQLSQQTKDVRIHTIDRKERLGKVATQNQVLAEATGDILVILDADVIPTGSGFLEKIIAPFLANPHVGLVSADTVSAPPETFLERIIADSHELKKSIYRKMNHGNTIYLCHGRIQALSKKFYLLLKWPEGYPEDAYSYLFCIQQGFEFVYVPQATIMFRSPAYLKDHARQSMRFLAGKKKLEELFSAEFVRKQYELPLGIVLLTFIQYAIMKPFSTFAYLFIFAGVKIKALGMKEYQQKWQIATSSKKVIS